MASKVIAHATGLVLRFSILVQDCGPFCVTGILRTCWNPGSHTIQKDPKVLRDVRSVAEGFRRWLEVMQPSRVPSFSAKLPLDSTIKLLDQRFVLFTTTEQMNSKICKRRFWAGT